MPTQESEQLRIRAYLVAAFFACYYLNDYLEDLPEVLRAYAYL